MRPGFGFRAMTVPGLRLAEHGWHQMHQIYCAVELESNSLKEVI